MNSGPGGSLTRPVAALLGAAIGASAWIALGVVAVVDPARMTRLVALPPTAWLAAAVVAGLALGALVRVPSAAVPPLSLVMLSWLPWLPLRLPAAFLMWDGPLEGAAWGAALLGAAWSWRAARAATPAAVEAAVWADVRRAPWLAAALTVVVVLTSWQVARPRVPAGDEPHYLVITQSLLRDGDLRIEDNHRDEQYLDYFEGALKPDFMRRGTDRQIYSIHAPGASVVVLPAFAIAGYPGAVVTVVLLVAWGIAMLWRAAQRLTGQAGAGWVAALALVVAAPYVLLAFTIYPDPIGSAVVAAGLAALAVLDTGGTLERRRWIALGAALALLPWLHTRFAVLAGALGVVLALRAWRGAGGRGDVVRFVCVPVVSAAAWFGFFWWIYGTPNPGAPYGVGTGSGPSFVPTGLAGLLIDQQFGLLANAPVLAVGVAGLVSLARRRPRLAIELVAVVLPYLMTAASFPMWWGGYSSPARFAVVVAPAFALPVAVLWARAATPVRAAIVTALVVSAALTAAIVGIDRGAFIYNGRDGHALVLDWLSQSVDLTLAVPSVHRDGATGAAADALVWLVAVVLVLAVGARVTRRVAATVAWLGAPLVMMAAATVVWAGLARPIVSTPNSQERFLGVWRDGGLPLGAQVSPARWLGPADVTGRLALATTTRGEAGRGALPLLQVPNVPAGEYDVFVDVEPGAEAVGTGTVRLGRQGRADLPLAQWTFDGRAGYGGLTLRLPVDAHSITVMGDTAARRSIRALTLRPRALAPPGNVQALRAARYGRVVVFALDDYAYLEPDAFWVRGERTTALVVGPDAGATPVMRLRAGPVANEVRLSAGPWQHTVRLAPEAAEDVTLPPEAVGPAVLSVTSTTGFRPSAHGGARGDVRWLGVYVTWPGPPS